ncbi:MAG TPA: kelch repeat-containing protein, partial [Terracidiphilus sp.]|nr:kelch repeat-containing protein [Terracidiphilus sp.]
MTAPPARYLHGLTYDPVHAQAVLFGGYGVSGFLNDTWLWNGTTWTQANPSSSPAARSAFGMTYDAAQGQVVLFGGRLTANSWTNDTWLWNGATWTQANPTTIPPARSNMAMVYDAAHGNDVMFGGLVNGLASNDTWIWHGTTWSQANPANSPSARYAYSMVYDAAHSQVVMFGGQDIHGNYLNETWTWDGTNWTQQSPQTSPSARDLQGMAYDAALGQVVMFGGIDSGGNYLNDTWVWNGTTWIEQVSSPTALYAREVPNATTYDAAQGQVILFGGFNSTGSSSTTFYDTWEWGTRQNFGNINVCPSGTTSPAPCSNTLTLTYSVSTATTFGTPQVVTQGTSGLDFTLASGSTCTGSVSAGSFCTVNVTFAPIAPGLRLGAVNLVDNLGNLLVSTAIYGIGQGPLAAFSPAPQTTLPTSSLNYPVGMALDGAGNRYIANYGSGNRAGFVVKVTPGGVQTTVLSSYTSAPSQNPAPIGVAVDGAGNLFIVDLYLPYAVKLAPNGVQTTLGSGLSFPIGIALDAVGDVFIGDQNNKRVVEVTPGGVQTTVPFTGLQLPWGVAVDAAGDVFVADGDQLAQPAIPSRVLEYSSGGVQTTVLSSGLSRAYDLAVDAAGDVIIADAGNSRVVGVTPGGAQFTVGSGLGFPSGVTVDGAGDVYIGDQGNQQVYEVSRSQGPSWNFGPVNVGGRSTDLGVTIQNIGNQTLTGTVGSPSNTNFGNDLINSTCTSVNEISLAPAATCVLDIYAQPTNVGALTGTVPVSDNSLNGSPSTQTIPLQVTGTGTVTSYTLTVTGVGSGTGTVTSGDGVISCSDAGGTVTGTCSSTYPANSPVTLTASAASGSIFLGWGGACASSGTSPQCDVAMSGPENVTASFGQQNFGNLNVCPVGQNTPAPCTSATTLTYNIPTTTIMGAIQVVTQGANGLDFALGSGSTCTGTISGGNSCNVNVTFTPLAAGLRLGAVKLFDNSGALVASTLIYGVGQAPLAVFSPGARVQVHTGTSLHYPNGLLADAAGNLFIADGDNQRVLKVSQNGSVTTVPASGLSLPQGMAEDGAGNLFIADNGNQVVEIPAGCTTSACQQFVPNPLGLQSELGVAVDGAGNLFVSDYLDGKVAEVPANGGPQTIVYNPTGCGNAPGCSDPVDLTTDAAGDLFIADLGLKTVAEVPPGCTTNSCVKHIGTGWNEPDDVAVDAAGDVFVADQGLGQIVEVPAGCNNSACQVVLVNGVYTVAVKVDAAGNLFFDNVTTNQVFEVTRSLPPSLSFALTNVGATSTDSPQVVTLQNVGNQPLSGTATTVAGASFSLLSTCGSGFTLIPGATCFENFGFIPQSTGYQAGSQSFSDDTMNLSQAVSLQTINLSGSGGLNGQAVGVQVPNVVGLTQAAATSSITGTGLATGTVSTAASSVIPSGSVIASNPAAGTVVNPGSAVRLLVSTGQAPPQTPNPLSLLNNLFVTGDYASAGVTLRGTGVGGKATGTITIPDSTTSPGSQGVPDGADIVDGLLYWETLENSQLPSGNTGTFLGYPITGQQIGSDIPFTDGALSGTLRVYRADVNSYFPVAANGSGVRTGSGAFTVSLPDSGGSGFPLTEGASLVVLYRVLSPNFPLKSVVIYDGSAVPAGPTSQNMLGFYDAVGGATGESTTLSYAAGSWNNIPTSVSLAAHASQYSAPLNAGTAYAAVILSMPVTNSDNDAILDAWKGGPGAADFYAGSPGYYDVKTGAWVPLPGAVHGEKDLFVQLDYMCGAVLANGSCDPTQENLFPAPDSNGNDPLAMVKNAFAADGVVLHLEIGNAVAEGICTDNTSVNPPQLCQFPNEPGVVGWKNSLEFSKIWPKNLASCAAGGDCSPRFPYGQKDSYHYVLFGHSLAIPAWNTRYQTLTAISVNNFVTTITTTDRGPQRRSDGTMNINYCPSRITISGVLGNPFLNGAYNTTSCADSQHITVATPTVPNWSYPNNTMPEPEIGLTSGTVTSISGYSDLGGSDSAVTLGLWETDPKQDMSRRANVIAGTLFHEIGHTLALSHGGLYYDNLPSYLPTFEENCKPNYQSSMNYLFQLDGVGPNGAVAYSNQTLQTLVQSSLGGVNSLTDTSSHAATFPTSSWYTPTQPSSTASQATFHCDGTPLTGDTGYRVDGSVVGTTPPTPLWSNGQNVTFDGVPPNGSIPYDPLPYSTLRGYNDAANLDLRQVGATGSEFASMAGLLSFGTSLTPLNIAPGGNVSLNAGGTVALGSGGTVTLGSGGNVTLGSGGTIALGSGGTVTLGSGGNVTLGSGGTIALGSGGTVTLGSGGNVTLGSGGTITLGSGGTVTLGSGGNVTLGSGGTIALGSGGSVTIPSTGGSYSIPNSGGTITLGSGGTITLGSGGNVTLGSGGTIAMGSGGNVTLGSGGNVTLGSGGTITLGSGG